ncbi:MAG: N-formylglutamate amidohydrolase [Herminiimonas sp.]|nr:N-formylglutamate amidohydrolase [Herminiimonas sp.]
MRAWRFARHRNTIPVMQPSTDFFLITCEHGGNRIPSAYRYFFQDGAALLHSHRGYDAGALRVARELARTLDGPLFACSVSRLLIELNRSPKHPRLYSEMTRAAPAGVRQELFERYYLPYRTAVEERIARANADGSRVIHISSQSFTHELNGELRNADVGLLYDPARAAEASLCRQWRSALKETAPALKTRMNYPYAGTTDGFTVHLRRRFAGANYLGIELELNQKHVLESAAHWRAVRTAVIEALRDAVQRA